MDRADAKVARGESRNQKLLNKSAAYQHKCSAPRSRSAAPADGARPHRLARAASRSLLARGFVETAADMPKVNGMEPRVPGHARRNPRAASLVPHSGADFSEEPRQLPYTMRSKAFEEAVRIQARAFAQAELLKAQVLACVAGAEQLAVELAAGEPLVGSNEALSMDTASQGLPSDDAATMPDCVCNLDECSDWEVLMAEAPDAALEVKANDWSLVE